MHREKAERHRRMQSRHQLVGNLKTRTLRTFNDCSDGPTSMRDLEKQIWMGIGYKKKSRKGSATMWRLFWETSAERMKGSSWQSGVTFGQKGFCCGHRLFFRGTGKEWHNLLKETFPIYKWQTQKAGIMRKTWKWTASPSF